MTSFAVVVVLHESRAHLERLLDSLDRHLAERPQVIAVDTGSTDGGPELAHERGAEVISLPDNPGFGIANNVGVRAARHDVTALLNPDVELLDDGLTQLVEAAHEQDALVFPRLLNPDGSVQDSAHPEPGTWREVARAFVPHRLARQPYETGENVGWVTAAALVARTTTLARLGPFDPAAFMFYEDMDLCLRSDVPLVLRRDVALRHEGGHSTNDDRIQQEAQRRREVVTATRGRTARNRDDLAQALTFARTAAFRRRARAQLRALWVARRA